MLVWTQYKILLTIISVLFQRYTFCQLTFKVINCWTFIWASIIMTPFNELNNHILDPCRYHNQWFHCGLYPNHLERSILDDTWTFCNHIILNYIDKNYLKIAIKYTCYLPLIIQSFDLYSFLLLLFHRPRFNSIWS